MPVRGLAGLEPDKLSTNILNLAPGSVNDSMGYWQFDFPGGAQIDLATNGLYGLDQGTMADGDGVYLYVLRNTATNQGALVASKSNIMAGVCCPADWEVRRKLPWGCIWRSSWDGIPNFHLSGWPGPFVRFTDAEYQGKWVALWQGKSQAWVDVQAASWIPDNARLGYFVFESRYDTVNGGTAGSSYVRSYGGQPTGLLAGSVSPGIPYQIMALHLRVDSLRHFQYRVTGTGCMLNVYVLGYSMTEPA